MGSGLRVLIVKDDSTNRILASNILKRNGYAIAIATDGLEAVEMCSRGTSDLILMDVQMPNLNGLEATAAIRKLHAMDGDRERCIAAGMDDYMSKPIHAKDLVTKITTLIAPARLLPESLYLPSTENASSTFPGLPPTNP